MNKIFIIIFSLFFTSFFAQQDREHWFAPMVDRVTGDQVGRQKYQAIYMSTGETTPFRVDIYFNNMVVKSVMISKNNPQKYIIPAAERERIIISPKMSDPAKGLFEPVPMGFYLKGERPFFASLRFSIVNHGEIQTSKGTAALGTEFRAVVAPLAATSGFFNFMNSVMATEDNTQVTVSGYKPDVVFTDEIPRSTITFTLNKGQSYIIEGSDSYYENYTGYIGAKIVSDKPVVIANGNFNGQYAFFTSSSDILMDQGVPVDKLGKTFVLVKGNGANSFDHFGTKLTMEKALVVAVKDQTKIYLNGNPTAVAILDAGDFYETPPDSYVQHSAEHSNMYLEASENVYVYQLLAGVNSDITYATGGFNFIPPLSCYLPRSIDEIGLIDENEYTANDVPYSLTVPTRLNLITEKGAVLTVTSNGTAVPITAANGPFAVSGNSLWETYSINHIQGNVSVHSTKAVTAGITAGNAAMGYGGFFAGFSSTPLITKIAGDCLADGVILGVIPGFDSYLWLEKVNGVYVPASEINSPNNQYSYKPSKAGIYAVKIKQGACTEVQTDDMKFFNCTDFTNISYTICSEQIITPKFALSSQLLNPASVKVTVPPTKGTATVATDGTVTYRANKNATGTDTFKFSFCGIGALPDCEIVQATVALNQIVTNDVVLQECSNTGSAVFNLTKAAVSQDPTVKKNYFKDDKLTQPIPTSELTAYAAADGTAVFVSLQNTFGCEAVARIDLKTVAPLILDESLYTKAHCDEDIDGLLDGNYKVDVSTITPVLLPNLAGLTVGYYASAQDAATENQVITGVFNFTTATNSVWIRVDANKVCPPVIKKIVLNIGAKLPITKTASEPECDNDLDNAVQIDLESYVQKFTTVSPVSVRYFDTLLKAQKGLPADEISANQTLGSDKTFYFRLKAAGFCEEIGQLNIVIKKPLKSEILRNKEICPETTTTLYAGEGFDQYVWSIHAQTTSEIKNVPIGTHWVDLYSNGCVYRQFVTVSAVALPQIVGIDVQESTVTVQVTGGNPPFQYSLDGGPFQASNVFTQVRGGEHTVSVISADQCAPVSAVFTVIEVYNVITPNGDGVNDMLNYDTLLKKEEPSLKIFDRFGNLLFTGDQNNRFSWDGKTAGKPVNTGTYWYILRWRESGATAWTERTGWVLVRNR